jgi:hypothetical protein
MTAIFGTANMPFETAQLPADGGVHPDPRPTRSRVHERAAPDHSRNRPGHRGRMGDPSHRLATEKEPGSPE